MFPALPVVGKLKPGSQPLHLMGCPGQHLGFTFHPGAIGLPPSSISLMRLQIRACNKH